MPQTRAILAPFALALYFALLAPASASSEPRSPGLPGSVPRRVVLGRSEAYRAGLPGSLSPGLAPTRGSTAASPYDGFWTDEFALPGLAGSTFALADYGGQLVLGGSMTEAGLVQARHVVSWDGSGWHALDGGIEGFVHALLPYAGGLVAAAGRPVGAAAGNTIQSWNGASWTVLGATDGDVYALVLDAGDLVVGGDFTNVNGVAAAGVARWDGAAWHALGGGAGGRVLALTLHAGQLVASGLLPDMNGVAAWNGATWSQLGAGLQDSQHAAGASVEGLVSDGTSLFAVGSFTGSGATSCPYAARWDGTNWNATTSQIFNPVAAIGLWQGAPVTTNDAGNPIRWDGGAWVPLGNPFLMRATAVHVFGTKLYVGGNVNPYGTGIVEFDGAAWNPLQAAWAPGMNGLPEYVDDLVAWNGKLVAAGGFLSAGASDHFLPASRLAAWDGSAWSNVGVPAAISGQVYAITTWQNDLIVGGFFPSAGGVTGTKDIASWNGSTWTPLGVGLGAGGWAFTLGTYGPDLIVSGFFYNSGSTQLNGVARWDGTTWHAMGSGISDQGFFTGEWAYALAEWNGLLVLGGEFTSVGDVPVAGLAAWNGTSYAQLGGGMNGIVNGLAVFEGDLVAAGEFTVVGGVPVHAVARWNGSTWTPMGVSALDLYRLKVIGGHLFALGEFSLGAGGTTDGLAMWNGLDWELLGSGFDGGLYALAEHGRDIYVGGSFGRANGLPAFDLARMTNGALLGVGPRRDPAVLALSALPNPGRGDQRLAFVLPLAGQVRLTVLDLAGRRLATLADGIETAGEHSVSWSGRDAAGRRAPAGVYFARLEVGKVERGVRLVRTE